MTRCISLVTIIAAALALSWAMSAPLQAQSLGTGDNSKQAAPAAGTPGAAAPAPGAVGGTPSVASPTGETAGTGTGDEASNNKPANTGGEPELMLLCGALICAGGLMLRRKMAAGLR